MASLRPTNLDLWMLLLESERTLATPREPPERWMIDDLQKGAGMVKPCHGPAIWQSEGLPECGQCHARQVYLRVGTVV